MNIHTDAGLTYAHRLELVMDILERDLALCAAATARNASVPTARKWAGRYLAEGEAGLRDRSSRSKRSPRAITPSKVPPAIVELRCRRLVQRRIAASVGVSKSAVGRVLTRAGLSRLRDLEPCALVVRYGHPGDLAHIDTIKLGRIERIDHRIIGDRRDTVDGAGCGSCLPPSTTTRESASPTFTPISARRARCSSRRTPRATSPRLGCASIACSPTTARRFAPRRSPSLARAWASSTASPAQTTGKAERFIQSALREWAYGIVCNHSTKRAAMLKRWTHRYNWHRLHQGISGLAPISRLAQSRNDLLTLHTAPCASRC